MITGFLVFLVLAPAAPSPSRAPAAPTASVGGIHWLENKGQWPEEVRYGAWIGQVWVAARSDGVDFHVSEVQGGRTQVVALRFEGLAAGGVQGLAPQPGLFHDYHGPESQWIRGVRSFGQVELARLSAGETIVLGLEGDRLQFEVCSVGSEAEPLRVRVLGAEGLCVLPDAGLSIQTPLGEVRLASPTFVQGGLAHSVLADLGEDGRVTWRAGPPAEHGLPASAPSAGPPELLWSTLWGGVPTISSNLGDAAEDVFVDGMGNVTVVGTVAGVDYLLTPATFHTQERNDDLFVARFRQGTGELVYSARVGSTSRDAGQAVAVDAMGRATVVGTVGQNAQGFPTTPNAYDPVKSQFDDAAVVFRLSPLGDQLEYSTYLEGTKRTEGYGVALAPSGAAVVTGFAKDGFPTTSGAYSSIFHGGTDVFVTRLDPTGSSLEFSTLIGGTGTDIPVSVVLDDQEFVYLAGETGLDFPTTSGAYKGAWTGVGTDAFVCCLDPTGSTLVWSTLLGGTNTETDGDLALAPNGDVVVTGTTSSTDFPTTSGALQGTALGSWDAYVARIGSSGTQLVYGSYLASTGFDNGRSIAVDGSGLITVVGSAGKDAGFPLTPGAFKTVGDSDAFLTVLRPDGSGALYSTLLGAGNGFDDGLSLDVRSDGLATMGGRVNPTFGAGGPFPTTPGALVPNHLGSMDAFITTFQPLLQGVQLLGSSSPSCLGPLKANAATLPLAGQPFSLYCSQAPPSAQGLFLTFRGEGLATFQLVQSDPNGYVETQLGTLPNQAGALRRYRYAFLGTATCAGPGAFTYSNLVLVQIQ